MSFKTNTACAARHAAPPASSADVWPCQTPQALITDGRADHACTAMFGNALDRDFSR
jgi:hypothetical protein